MSLEFDPNSMAAFLTEEYEDDYFEYAKEQNHGNNSANRHDQRRSDSTKPRRREESE
jgi:hypothetical protein